VNGDLRASAGATSMQSMHADSDADRQPESEDADSVHRHGLDPYDSDPRAKELSTRREAHLSPDRPFKPAQLARIDEALTLASRETGLLFSLYVGDLGPSSRATAEAMFATLAARHHAPVLVALSPAQRRLEIVTGGESARRIPNRTAGLAALAMRGSFANGDLTGGIVTGLRQLADAAGRG
jgi:Domain of unknown function (DUF5130)